MPIRLDVLGYKEIEKKLSDMPVEVADYAIGDVQSYLLNALRINPPKNFVTRASAYPNVYATSPTGKKIRGFFSWKQFRLVAAKYNEGQVPYKRTQELSRGWHIAPGGKKGLFGKLVNYVEGVVYVMGERKQSRHEAMVGWKKPSQIVAERMEKINMLLDAAAKKGIRKVGLK